jgi:structural maintenance of chromosome 4
LNLTIQINGYIYYLFKAHIETALQNMTSKKDELQMDIKEVKIHEEKIIKEIEIISEKITISSQQAKENNSHNNILNELMKAQQRRELSGICGRLGDLGAIDERYDIAVTSACPQLDYIVVSVTILMGKNNFNNE